MNSVYERDHVLVEIGDGGMADDVISIGHNFEAVLSDLETRMREAAADLNNEEPERQRDAVKRLRATELAVVDDPTAKQRVVQGKAGAYAGTKKYGDAANLPAGAMKKRFSSPSPGGGGSRAAGARGGVKGSAGASSPSPRPSRDRDEQSSLLEGRGEGQPTGGASVPSPLAGESLPPTGSGGQGGGPTSRAGSKVHKPHLDKMHGPESLPYRPGRTSPRKPSRDDAGPSTGSKIFQPTSSREAVLGRSTGGAPGHRGGWKKR